MIIKTSPVGQLCNRIYDFSTFIAYSIENNQKLIYPHFDEYKDYFSFTENAQLQKLKISYNISKYEKYFYTKLLLHLSEFKFFKNFISLSAANSSFSISNYKSDKSFQLFDGKWYTDYKNFSKNADLLRSIFSLKEPYLSNVNNVFYGKKYDKIIGVHLRRGDYKEFLDGKFYFDDDFYKQKMTEIEDYFPNLKLGFLLCSNEEIQYSNFSEFEIISSSGLFVEDLYCLAKCHYIIGPPSTFTMWASFYGKTPLFKMSNKEDKIKFEVLEEY